MPHRLPRCMPVQLVVGRSRPSVPKGTRLRSIPVGYATASLTSATANDRIGAGRPRSTIQGCPKLSRTVVLMLAGHAVALSSTRQKNRRQSIQDWYDNLCSRRKVLMLDVHQLYATTKIAASCAAERAPQLHRWANQVKTSTVRHATSRYNTICARKVNHCRSPSSALLLRRVRRN